MITPIMLSSDKAAWRMLYLGAREVCVYPASQSRATAFTRAGVAANRAVFPDQTPNTVKVFTQLVQFALAWRACDVKTRIANSVRVLELASDVCWRLGDETPPPRPPTPSVAAPRQYKDDSFDDDAERVA